MEHMARVRQHLQDGGTQATIPCANQLWMLFGFELFTALSVAGWPCIEVYPQATVRAIGVGEQHKSTAGAVLEQLEAAAPHTGWPSRPTNFVGSATVVSTTNWTPICQRRWRACRWMSAKHSGILRTT